MDDITHAEQVEPGRWHVYVARWNFRQVKVMTALQFSRMLAGEPYETEYIFTEWEEGYGQAEDGPSLLDR